MNSMGQMTLHEKLALAMKSIELEKAGKLEEAIMVQKMLPIEAPLAKTIKENFGAEALKACGLNLSEAEAVYGKDWLTR
ncbi:hypothetical protein AGMMS49579_00500 [Spirochaetia bacterium]|nr:hypothetical protein AGMMS49579_00390 [Spirochaetia bacterium]GHV49301.1 hypothetical protein AGMMS49579_00500 [Spirochaetia bacterium]